MCEFSAIRKRLRVPAGILLAAFQNWPLIGCECCYGHPGLISFRGGCGRRGGGESQPPSIDWLPIKTVNLQLFKFWFCENWEYKTMMEWMTNTGHILFLLLQWTCERCCKKKRLSNDIVLVSNQVNLCFLCIFFRTLDLSFNLIKTIENLGCLTKVKKLFLVSNKISKIEGLQNLLQLEMIELGANKIRVSTK